jgi:hypothetical protein
MATKVILRLVDCLDSGGRLGNCSLQGIAGKRRFVSMASILMAKGRRDELGSESIECTGNLKGGPKQDGDW